MPRWITREEAKRMADEVDEVERLLKEVDTLEKSSKSKSEEINRLKREIASYETKLKGR